MVPHDCIWDIIRKIGIKRGGQMLRVIFDGWVTINSPHHKAREGFIIPKYINRKFQIFGQYFWNYS